MSALNTEDLEFLEKCLHVPTLEEVRNVLQTSLQSNFKTVKVEVVSCPDLKKAPFKLAASGLGGSPTLIEVGGPPYLLPNPDLSRNYNIKEIVKRALGYPKNTEIMAIGAGAGPYMIRDTNCEGVYNLSIDPQDNLNNESITAKIVGVNENVLVERYPKKEERFAILGNIFASEGKCEQVLRVQCSQRAGLLNFIESIRLSLAAHYKDKSVGLGGVFLIKNGLVHQHVMRDFSKTPIHTETELNTWLKFFDMPAPLTALGTLVTNECDLDLRLQHFHTFSDNWGGHYHYDTTPETIEYEGYFAIGEKIVRVDKPINTHKFGRD